MPKEKFLLVSLSDSKTKHLAQVMSNETARKILDYLAEKEATESELAEKLNVPISTVHYNLQQLKKGGLVVSEEFHYSQKGKEISHYKLANKYIIIAPKSTYGIKEKLKSILPVALVIAAAGAFIEFFSRSIGIFGSMETTKTLAGRGLIESADEAIMPLAAEMAEAAPAQAIADNVTTTTTITHPSIFANIALWFFIGAVAAISIYLLIDWIRNRKG